MKSNCTAVNTGVICTDCDCMTVPLGESSARYNPAEVNKCAAQIAVHHRRLMDAMTTQGPNEVAAAIDALECSLQGTREALGLS